MLERLRRNVLEANIQLPSRDLEHANFANAGGAVPDSLRRSHFRGKHGRAAYYGQR